MLLTITGPLQLFVRCPKMNKALIFFFGCLLFLLCVFVEENENREDWRKVCSLEQRTDEWKKRWVTGNVKEGRKENETEPIPSGVSSKISNLTPSWLVLGSDAPEQSERELIGLERNRVEVGAECGGVVVWDRR